MIAANIMTTKVLTVPLSASMLEAFCLVSEKKVRQIPILDGQGRVAGVITPRSLMKAILPKYITEGLVEDVRFAPELPDFAGNMDALAGKRVEDLLEKDFASVSPETSVMEVATLLVNAKKHAESVLVLDDRRTLLGIISPWDIFKRVWDYADKNKK